MPNIGESSPFIIGESNLQPWKVLKSEDLFVANPWIALSVHQVRLPDDRVVDDYYQIELPEFAMIYARTSDDKVIVERMYKHGLRKVVLTLPAGLLESGEQPLMSAQRELLEETGYRADEWRGLGSFVINGNYGCGKAHLFEAIGAHQVAEPHSGDLEQMEIVLMKPHELVDALGRGYIETLGAAALIALATNPAINDGAALA